MDTSFISTDLFLPQAMFAQFQAVQTFRPKVIKQTLFCCCGPTPWIFKFIKSLLLNTFSRWLVLKFHSYFDSWIRTFCGSLVKSYNLSLSRHEIEWGTGFHLPCLVWTASFNWSQIFLCYCDFVIIWTGICHNVHL